MSLLFDQLDVGPAGLQRLEQNRPRETWLIWSTWKTRTGMVHLYQRCTLSWDLYLDTTGIEGFPFLFGDFHSPLLTRPAESAPNHLQI